MKKKTPNTILKQISLDEMIDKDIGKVGTKKRNAFEKKLSLDVMKKIRRK